MAAVAEGSSGGATSVRLVYELESSAGSCPDEATLRAAVVRRVGFDPFDEAAARVISCRVQRTGRLLRARIDIGDGTGQPGSGRELFSSQGDCRELAEATALALSIAIKPWTVAARTSPETGPKPAESTPRVARPATLAVASRPTAPFRERVLYLGLRAQMATGLQPGFAYGGTLSLALRRRWLSAGLELRVLAPSSIDVGAGTLHVWQWATVVAPCAHGGGFAACLFGSAGMMVGRGEGFAISTRSSSPSAAAGVGGAWEHALSGERLRLFVALDWMASLTRIHFTLGGMDAWTSPPVAVSLGAGVQGAFF
jgi:hypothetical protein